MAPIEQSHTASLETNLEQPPKAVRPVLQALFVGAKLRCPNCGKGSIFSSYLKIAETCKICKEELHHHRADDAPSYFTIFLVGHIIVPLIMAVELGFRPSYWVHAALWLPLSLGLALALLPPIKGAIVGLQWALYMHGFESNEKD